MRRLFRALAVTAMMAGAVGVSACAPTAQNTAQNLAAEQQRSAKLVREMESKGAIIKSRGINNYVQKIHDRIAAQRPPGSVPLKVFVIKDADVNAFTTGGGYVYYNAGLLAAMENEAQVAAVVAHEIAHIDRGHLPAGAANRQAVQIGAVLGQLAGAAAGINPNLTQMVVGLGANAYSSNYSRTQERDADDTAVRYMAAAGYNAAEGAKSFQVLERLYGNNRGVFSTHPAPGERFASQTAQAKQLGATKGRIAPKTHKSAVAGIRKEVLKFYDANGRTKEAAQVRRALRQ